MYCKVLGFAGVNWGEGGCRYGDYKMAWLSSLPPLSDQQISIKPAFSCMKIVQNYKEYIIRSVSDSTYIVLLKIQILFGLAVFYAESFLLSERFSSVCLRISTRYKAIFINTFFDLNS